MWKDARSLKLISSFSLCVVVFLKASYTFSGKVSGYFEYSCKTFDLRESPYMASDPARTFMHSEIQMTYPTY